MRIIPFHDLQRHVGSYLGASDWHEIRQDQTDLFAALTGDDEWIHVDVDRAAREIGGTIIHGYHLLALIPLLSRQIYRIDGVRHGLNYGLDHLRFLHPVSHGARVRLHQRLSSVTPRAGGSLITLAARVDLEAGNRPAIVADCRFLLFPDADRD